MYEETKLSVDEFWGRPNPELSPQLWALQAQGIVNLTLACHADAMMQVLQLCQQYLPDETLLQILGPGGLPIARSREEIQGTFRIELTFDASELAPEYMEKIGMLTKQIVPLDTEATILRDRLVDRLVTAMDPDLAEDVISPKEQAQRTEVKDEEEVFAKMKAGVEPEMMQSGQNFALRLRWHMMQAQRNPDSVKNMTPDAQQIYERRIKHLTFMVQQLQNAMIGKTGVSPAGAGGMMMGPEQQQQGPPAGQ